jgi:hypothetical protein
VFLAISQGVKLNKNIDNAGLDKEFPSALSVVALLDPFFRKIKRQRAPVHDDLMLETMDRKLRAVDLLALSIFTFAKTNP